MQNHAQYRVIGMDCAADAAEIEQAARAVAGVDTAKVSTASQIMTVRVDDQCATLSDVERAVTVLGYRLDRLGESQGTSDDDELPADPSQLTAAYKRALWVVVLLNVGYGVVEMAGGFFSGSQALRAAPLNISKSNDPSPLPR